MRSCVQMIKDPCAMAFPCAVAYTGLKIHLCSGVQRIKYPCAVAYTGLKINVQWRTYYNGYIITL